VTDPDTWTVTTGTSGPTIARAQQITEVFPPRLEIDGGTAA